MTKNQDPRHEKRIKLMQALFSLMFTGDDVQSTENEESMDQAKKILNQVDEIDAQLVKHAPERPLVDINQVDLAILRLILHESKNKKTPKKVLIDEAVELAKEFGTDSSPKFVNGVLGKILIKSEDSTDRSPEQKKEEKNE